MRKAVGVVVAAILVTLLGFVTVTPAQATGHGITVKNSPSSDSWIQVCYDHKNCRKLNPGDQMVTNYWKPAHGSQYDYHKVTINIVGAGSWKQRWDVDSDGYGSCHSTGSDRVQEFEPSNSIDNRIDVLLYDRTKCRH